MPRTLGLVFTLILTLASAGSGLAATETASGLIYCQSFELFPASPVSATGLFETTYYSTFNGTAGAFLEQNSSGGAVVSGELRPRSGDPGAYEGGYGLFASFFGLTDYGSYVVNLPTADTTGIGLPDVLNLSQPGSFTATGAGSDTAAGGTPFSISFNFSRAAGSTSGTYTVTTSDTAGDSAVSSGQFQLVDWQATVTYSRGATNMMSITVVNTGSTSLTGSTTYTVTSDGQVNYAAFTISSATGDSYPALAGTLNRAGNTYLGTLQFADGLPLTAWADYNKFQFEIVDPNNTNGSAIPDFSAPLTTPTPITSQPLSQTVAAGAPVTFTVTAPPASTYQWSDNGVPIPGATSSSLSIGNVQPGSAGSYTVTVTNSSGSATSSPAILTVNSLLLAPSFSLQPSAQTAAVGAGATFSSLAAGNPAPTYQWLYNGSPIPGATDATLTLSNLTAASAGNYVVVATNANGAATSSSATLTVSAVTPPTPPTPPAPPTPPSPPVPPTVAPLFTTEPAPQTVASGSTVVFSSSASGSPSPTFQWFHNGAAIANATSSTLLITDATSANAGTYTCVATNSQGSITSSSATLSFAAATLSGRLINLSVNASLVKGQVLTIGFVTGGAGTSGTQNLLIRATGPALSALGVPNVLADPTLSLLRGQTIVASNDNWGAPSSNQTAVTAADSATGAFPLTNPASLDAALVTAPAAGAYTVQISGNNLTAGTTLAEVYDDTPAAAQTSTSPRLINISANNQITANGSMTAGFVVGGTTAETVLIRATGPALTALGVAGAIPDPQLKLHTTVNNQDTVLATNSGWGGDPQITAAGNSVGAFPLTNPNSNDSVVLVTLPAGAYTAVASSASGTAGVVLIEVYEVP